MGDRDCGRGGNSIVYATGYGTSKLENDELVLMAIDHAGHPVGAGISLDSNTLYVAESGAIDIIPLPLVKE